VTVEVNSQNAATSAGTSSNLLLRFGTSSRVSGLSESFTGVADDINALIYNPAGLPNLRSFSISLNHAQWLEDIRIDNIMMGYGTERLGVGIGVTHMWMPAIQGQDYLGRETGEFNVSSSILDIGLGYELVEGFHAGLGVKYFQDNLADVSADGFAFDAGLYLKTFIDFLTFGLAVQNAGGKIKYIEERQNIPFSYRAGLAYQWIPFGINFSADLVKSIDTDYNINFGIEYRLQREFSFRIGNRYGFQGAFAPSIGAGMTFSDNYSLDYTFYHVEELGATHRVGFSFALKPTMRPVFRHKVVEREVVLMAPRNLDVSIRYNSLNLIWEPVYGAMYNGYARVKGDSNWVKLNHQPLTTSSMRFRIPGRGDYEFRVTAMIDGVESEPSYTVGFNTQTREKSGIHKEKPVILPPGDVRSRFEDGTITLYWDEIDGAVYFIYVLAPGSAEWKSLYRDPLYTSYVKFKAKREGFYIFRVTSFIDGKESPHSEEVTVDVQ
jgi:hypothetical protein